MEIDKLCKFTLEDENGNTVTIFVPADSHISKWIDAFRRVLRFQEFDQQTITAYLGD